MTRAEGIRLLDVAEGAVLVEYPDAPEEEANRRAVAAARSLVARPPAGFLDAVPGARTLLVDFEPHRLSRARLAERLLRRSFPGAEAAGEPRRLLELPVFYDMDPRFGPDLADLASGAGLSPPEFARRHASAEYNVAFLGFAPGFPYLTGLPAELHAPRLSTPRTRVPAGSVGIGGQYTGIYPGETPGGWRLIGRAPVRLFDALRDPPALLLPGDGVRFRAIGRGEFERMSRIPQTSAADSPPSLAPSRPLFRLATPGVLTSVQGGPRRGWGIYGVPPGGAMDPESLGHGNILLGNPRLAAALELTLVGPDLEVLSDAVVALSGGADRAAVNGRSVEAGIVFEVRAGDSLKIGPLRSVARAYLCVGGGLEETPRPRPPRRLATGDVVSSSGLPARREDTHRGGHAAGASGEAVIRVLPGPQRERFEPEGRAIFLGSPFSVSASSDRRGIRLEGPAVANRESPDILPEGTPLGAVQVPRDGQPIILGPDRPVTGGYAKIATVIAADFPRLARALPGTVVRFAQVTLAEALAAQL